MRTCSRDCTVQPIRVAALYDIHGNLPALEAALADVERGRPDVIVCGGDVALGPMPVPTIERLRSLGDRVRFVMGNADREVLAAYDRPRDDGDSLIERWTAWVAGRLEREHRDFLASFAPAVTVAVEGVGTTLFCHGSPRRDDEIITSLTEEGRLAPMLAGVEADAVVCGHTHAQFDRRVGSKRVINAGAVGMPYEGRPGAFWLLLGPDVHLRRSEYHLDAAVARMRQTGFPELDELLGESLLEPLPQREVASLFERQATDT